MKYERWKPVGGFEGLYEVSNLGRVRSSGRWCAGPSKSRAFFRPGRVLAPVAKSNGYLAVTLTKPDARIQYAVHVLVLGAFRGPRPTGAPHTRHRDGDKTNNRLSNLVYGTVAENEADRRAHGTLLLGSRHPAAVLTEAQAKRIRVAPTLQRAYELALQYGVSANHGWSIYTGKTWKHLA